jgi:CheY-like chemotaxis protein
MQAPRSACCRFFRAAGQATAGLLLAVTLVQGAPARAVYRFRAAGPAPVAIGPAVLPASFHFDYNVLEAADGTDALELVRAQPVRALVTDVHMPGLAGAELIGRLCRGKGAPAPLIIMCSGSEPDEAVRPGCDALLRKPVDIEELARTLERLAPDYSRRCASAGSCVRTWAMRCAWMSASTTPSPSSRRASTSLQGSMTMLCP